MFSNKLISLVLRLKGDKCKFCLFGCGFYNHSGLCTCTCKIIASNVSLDNPFMASMITIKIYN